MGFLIDRCDDRPIGRVNGESATYYATITEAAPPFALAAVLCDFRRGASIELVPYVPLTVDSLRKLSQLVDDYFGGW